MGTLHTASPLRVVRMPLFLPIPLLTPPPDLLPFFETGRGATAGSSTSRVSPELRVDARGRGGVLRPPWVAFGLLLRRNALVVVDDFLAGTVFFFGLRWSYYEYWCWQCWWRLRMMQLAELLRLPSWCIGARRLAAVIRHHHVVIKEDSERTRPSKCSEISSSVVEPDDGDVPVVVPVPVPVAPPPAPLVFERMPPWLSETTQ